MLMGEHSVLHGYPALVGAVNKRLTLSVSPRDDRSINVDSTLGIYQASLNHLPPDHTFRFTIATLHHFLPQMSRGVDITIASDIDTHTGLGSSAALVVALSAALAQMINSKTEMVKRDLLLLGRDIIREVQGRGSGSDVAASLYGGVVYYHPKTGHVESIEFLPSLCAVYCGYKTPTPEVIDIVEKAAKEHPEIYQQLYQQIGEATKRGAQALTEGDLSRFAEVLTLNQSLMQELGVSDGVLDQIVEELCDQPCILAAKISGSGLGDSVIGLMSPADAKVRCTKGQLQDVALAGKGISYVQ